MKALGLVAGPRKGQVTDKLIDAALKGASERGLSVEKIYLYDINIQPCIGCMKCRDTKKCFINDDHQMILDKMDSSDIVIFGSPTYVSNITSVAKVFMDRSIRFFSATKFGPQRDSDKPSKVILITSCAAPFPFSVFMGISTGSMNAMKSFFRYMKVKIRTIVAAGSGDFDEKKHAQLLKKAYVLGKTI